MSHWKQSDIDRLGNGSNPEKKKRHKFNAVPVIVDGVKYDSTREYNFKVMLDRARINYTMKHKFVLQNKFRYLGEMVREISIKPDFVIFNRVGVACAIVDVKGMITEPFKLRVKMLQRSISNSNKQIPIFLPSSDASCSKVILELLSIV